MLTEAPQDADNICCELQRLYRVGTKHRGISTQCLAGGVGKSVEFNDATRYVSIDGERNRAWIDGLRRKDANAQQLSVRAALLCECEPAFGDWGTLHASILVQTAQLLGKAAGLSTSTAKQKAARANGKLGGRPRKAVHA